MQIKCVRSVLTKEGMADITFYFDTETLEFNFDEKDYPLLIKIFTKEAQDIPETAEYSKES